MDTFTSSSKTLDYQSSYLVRVARSKDISVTQVALNQLFGEVQGSTLEEASIYIRNLGTHSYSTKGSFGTPYYVGSWTTETASTQSFSCYSTGSSSGSSSTKVVCTVVARSYRYSETHNGTKWSYLYGDPPINTHWDAECSWHLVEHVETVYSVAFLGSTYRPAYALAGESFDGGTVVSAVSGVYSTTERSTKTATGYTAVAGSRITYSSTYTDFTSAMKATTANRLTTQKTKTWGSAYARFASSDRPISERVIVVEASDCVVTADFTNPSVTGFVAPGTYVASVFSGNLVLGGDSVFLNSGPIYVGGPGYSSSYSYGDYRTATRTCTVLGETALTEATATQDDVVPLDGRLGVVYPIGTTLEKQTTFTYSETTTSYSYSGVLGRLTELPGFSTTLNPSSPYPVLAPDGNGVEWMPSYYSEQFSSLRILDTYDTSDTYSNSYTTTTIGWLPFTSRTTRSGNYTNSTRTQISGIERWGQEPKLSSRLYTTGYTANYAYSADYYSQYPDLIFSGGWKGISFGSSLGSNLDAQGAPKPMLRESRFGSFWRHGARVPMLGIGETGSVDDAGVRYSTTYLGDGLFSAKGVGDVSVGTLSAVGNGSVLFFGVPYRAVVYDSNGRSSAPTTVFCGWAPGEEPHDRTITFRAPANSSWNSFGAWAYTSINTVTGGTTLGTTQYCPAINPKGTTMTLGAEHALIFSTADKALTSTYVRYSTYTATTANSAFDAGYYSTFDLWKY